MPNCALLKMDLCISITHHGTGRSPSSNRHGATVRSVACIVELAQALAWFPQVGVHSFFFPPAERGWWRGNEISSFQLFCTQPVKAKCQKQMICGTTQLSFLPQKNRQDLWTSWKINEEKGRRLRCNPVNEMKSIQDETCGTQNNHSLLIVVCCLGKRTERNSFYYPVTYLSPGKDRDPSLIDFITSETTQLLPWRVHSTSLRDTSLPLHGLHMIESEEKLHAAQSCSLLHKY